MHYVGGGASWGWHIPEGEVNFGPYLVDREVTSMRGVKQRFRCSRNHWSSNRPPGAYFAPTLKEAKYITMKKIVIRARNCPCAKGFAEPQKGHGFRYVVWILKIRRVSMDQCPYGQMVFTIFFLHENPHQVWLPCDSAGKSVAALWPRWFPHPPVDSLKKPQINCSYPQIWNAFSSCIYFSWNFHSAIHVRECLTTPTFVPDTNSPNFAEKIFA